MHGEAFEIRVGRQHFEPVTNAQLRKERVNCADLHTRAPAVVSQIRGIDMILPIRRQQRQRFESHDDVLLRPRTCEPL